MNPLAPRWRTLAAFALLWLVAASSAFAVAARAQQIDVPKNQGWVTDLAGMLESDRKQRLEYRVGHRDKRQELLRVLTEEIWPAIPRSVLGTRISKKEKERILGYGPDGV